ncbi:hypothetical protein H0H92_001339 [Tricholoma furcatifolium]|nr:hypothetical protein H0H92_001339 [Tricholoma furcatifolium]
MPASRLVHLRAHLPILRKSHSLPPANPRDPRTRSPREKHKWPVEPHLLPKLQAGLRDISGKAAFYVHAAGTPIRLCYAMGNRAYQPPRVPPNTRGYLYYHHAPGTPPACAELRFRVVGVGPGPGPTEDDPDSDPDLKSGEDLRLPHSFRPWSCSLFRLAGSKAYQPLWDVVSRRCLDDATARWVRENAKNKHVWRSSNQMLHYLEQPFVMDMRCFNMGLGVVTRRFGFGRVVLQYIMKEKRGGSRPSNVYDGHLVLRFERSTLPEHAHARVLVIRILKILPPVDAAQAPADDKASKSTSKSTSKSKKAHPAHDSDSHLIEFPFDMMKEGQLLEKRKPHGLSTAVYAIHLDAVHGAGGAAENHKALELLLLEDEARVR